MKKSLKNYNKKVFKITIPMLFALNGFTLVILPSKVRPPEPNAAKPISLKVTSRLFSRDTHPRKEALHKKMASAQKHFGQNRNNATPFFSSGWA
jgi:hypothetical protein